MANATLTNDEAEGQEGFSRRWTVLPASLAGLVWAAGCASPGVPRPPSLKLPAPAKGLTAERVGEEVRLRWTTPSETTDGETIKGRIVAVVCREERVPGPCTPVDRREVTPGASAADITLTGTLAEGPARLLGFRVALENAKGRADDATPPVLVASGQAPGPVEALHITATREGALLRWRKMPDEAAVEVRREVMEVSSAVPAEAKGGPGGGTRNKGGVEVLRGRVPDVGGMVDHEAVRPVQYRYTAQRVLSVRLNGKDLLLRGPESAAVAWTLQDVFPPAAPTGLAAVPGPESIDLSWDAGIEADLAGYFVLRRAGDGPERKLNAAAVAGPAYRDTTAVQGITYRYRVTAIDKKGNEGEPSAEVQETLP